MKFTLNVHIVQTDFTPHWFLFLFNYLKYLPPLPTHWQCWGGKNNLFTSNISILGTHSAWTSVGLVMCLRLCICWSTLLNQDFNVNNMISLCISYYCRPAHNMLQTSVKITITVYFSYKKMRLKVNNSQICYGFLPGPTTALIFNSCVFSPIFTADQEEHSGLLSPFIGLHLLKTSVS